MIFRLKKYSYKRLIALLILLGSANSPAVFAFTPKSLALLEHMPNASLAIADDASHSLHEDKPMVPASTLKVFTALLAFKTWSPEHRFVTEFYLDEQQILWVKGFGDPFLISEELNRVSHALKNKGLTEIKGIAIDSHYFASDIHIDGKSHTQYPYDAPVGAVAANFNTVTIIHKKTAVYSGEAQTPLTPLTQNLAKFVASGYHRVNLGEQANSARYFAELLRAKLQQQGVKIGNVIKTGQVPADLPVFYSHKNSHTLSDVVAEMLEHSNNFIANQLFLMMGAERYGAPATVNKSQRAAAEKVKQLFGWKQPIFYEGSGLSYKNHLTAKQFLEVLEKFSPYKNLLKSQGEHILAKTGTLTGVSSYAGYLYKSNKWIPFALFINQPVQGSFRKQLAQELLSLKAAEIKT